MTDLPIHPHTGLRAIGMGRRGPIWPVMGGDGTTDPPPADPPTPPAPPADPPAGGDDGDLGDAGKKALATERAARKAAEAELAKYRKAEQDRADADKSETERRAAAEERAAAAELRAMRIEVATEKGLTPAQAKRLVGTTREELEADADDLLATFPTKAAGTGTVPPDPSQGPRGTQPPDTDALIKVAQDKGDWREVLRLQNSKLKIT